MNDSRSIPTLAVALLVALGLHAALLPWGASVLASSGVSNARPVPPERSNDSPVLDTPDLVIGRTWSPPRVALDTPTRIRFEVLNRSGVPASVVPPAPWWLDAVFLSRDRSLDAGDALLSEADALNRLAAGAVYEVAIDVTITDQLVAKASSPAEAHPDPDHASWFLLFVADVGGAVDEGPHETNNAKAVPVTLLAEPEEPSHPELGEDDAPTRLTVAWISHEAFEALRAPDGRTVQPAVQSRVDPTPDAPLRPAEAPAPPAAPVRSTTPTDPAPFPIEAGPAQPTPTDAAQVEPAEPETATAEPDRAVSPLPDDATGVALLSTAPEVDAVVTAVDPAAPSTPVEKDAQAEASPPPTPVTPVPSPDAEDPQPVQPTSAPRGDADADPADLVAVPVLRPGAVDVSEGLQITPSPPDIAITARLTTIPDDAVVKITFDMDGTVIDAELVTTTGSVTFDAPIRASLFRWTAQGEQLAGWEAPHTFRFSIYLTDRKR